MKQKVWVSMTERTTGSNYIETYDRRIKKHVIECDTMEEAELVKSYALQCKEMFNVKIRKVKPYYTSTIYFVLYQTKEDRPRWFVPLAYQIR